MEFDKRSCIDLHIHSTASDGTLTPSEIVDEALRQGLRAFAITDHDTIEGVREAISYGIPASLDFISGVEISAAPPESFSLKGSFHILGYAVNTDSPELNEALCRLQKARSDRNPHMIRRLNELGFDISLDEVVAASGDGQAGRPHIAQVMVGKGFAESIDDAFNRYIGKGKPAYVDKYRIPCNEAIDVIKGAGGIPVLAHPYVLGINDRAVMDRLVGTLKKMGMMGMEVYYPEHTPLQVAYYEALAENHGMLVTGGSDFHGSLKSDIRMGSGRGDLHVPYRLYEALVAALK